MSKFRVVFIVGYDEFDDDDIIQYSAEEFNSIEEAVLWVENTNTHYSYYIEEDVSPESLSFFGFANIKKEINEKS